MTHRAFQAFIATLLAVAVSVAGAAVAVGEDPPPDEQVNLRCIYESLIGVPVDDHPDTDTACFRIARNQNCTGTGESRVCDDETPWPEFTIPALYTDSNYYRGRTDAERTQIRVAHIVERSLSTRCAHYTTSDEPTAGAHRRICLTQTVSRAQVIACQSAVAALGYRRVHDLYVDGGTFNCPSAPRRSSTQSQQQSRDTAQVVVVEVDEPETAQQQSDEQQSDEQQSDEQQSDEQQSDEQQSDEQQSDEQQSDEQQSDEQQSDEQQSDEQQPRTRSASELAWIASQVARQTGQSCSVIDGRVTCTP